jgi:hypothetical protein
MSDDIRTQRLTLESVLALVLPASTDQPKPPRARSFVAMVLPPDRCSSMLSRRLSSLPSG